MNIPRRFSKVIKIRDVRIGGKYPVAIQSMAKVKTSDVEAVGRSIEALKSHGCEIVRLAVKDNEDARALKKIKGASPLPIVADIHFSWRLALEAIESGVDKIRLNPGNIYRKDQVASIAGAAKAHHIPIRVGINSGSLRSRLSARAGRRDCVKAMVKSAVDYIGILEKNGFYDIVVSLKASNIPDTIAAYRKMAKRCDYPFHLGLTATGLPASGAIKSAVALGALLLEGIGDTIRVSLTDSPEKEVEVAKTILEATGLRTFGGLRIISCPTCGRCEVDVAGVVKELEKKLSVVSRQLSDKPVKVAVMGCVVNGPGEASGADIGIAFGKKEGLLFKKGKPGKKVSFSDCCDALINEIRSL